MYVLAYVIGLGARTVTPLTLPPAGAAATTTTVWTQSQLGVIDSVGAKYASIQSARPESRSPSSRTSSPSAVTDPNG